MFPYQSVHQLLHSFLQRHHIPKDAYPVTGASQHFWPTLSGLFGHGTSGKDRQHTSFASSRMTSSFYLRVYSGFYCRTQIPSGAFSLQPSSSIIFSYNQPSSSAKGQNEVGETFWRQLSQSFSCLFVHCSMSRFWQGASGHLEAGAPLYWGLFQCAPMPGFWQMS